MSQTSLLLTVLLLAPPSWSQQLGTIQGKVVDARNSPIPAATVRLSSSPPGPPLETLAEIDGTFSFPNLPSGTYQLVVEMRGFEKFAREGVAPAAETTSPLTSHLAPSSSLRRHPRGRPLSEIGRDAGAERRRPVGTSPSLRGNRIGRAGNRERRARSALSPATSPPCSMREDNSDLLVISGTSTASLASGDWNDPAFRERMMEMRERMGFGRR